LRLSEARDLARYNLKPLWERGEAPRSLACAIPEIWRYADVRPALERATHLIDASRAGRRVLVLENPSLAGTFCIAPTLFTGFQLILPGEAAPPHRHTANALRFVVEGEGGYTNVDAARIAMHPGDLIVTPGWAWHDHGNEGRQPVIWMDGLDAALARVFGAAFQERSRGHAAAPVSRATREPDVFPYARMHERLQHSARDTDPDPCHGYRERYRRESGKDPIPSLAIFLQWLPAGFAGHAYCSTASTVFHVAAGSGRVTIGDKPYEFARHDVFVVPSWTPCALAARGSCMLFSYSDQAAQEALGFWREKA
jgi:gentisate 1,2-dioxygenase